MKLANRHFKAKLRDVVADKEYTISLHIAQGEGPRSADRHVLVFQIRDKRIKEVWHYIPNQEAREWFLSNTAADT